jgi:ATP adenylyltransferase
MIVPYEHLSDLDMAAKPLTDEMMDLTKRAQTAIRSAYEPDGFNFGMNLGKAAGAGVAGHFHQHVLPRWIGDVNFMTSVGQTRSIPESLQATYQKLKGKI